MIIFLSVIFFLSRFFTNWYTFDFKLSLLVPLLISVAIFVVLILLGEKLFKSREAGLITGFLMIISPWQHALIYRSNLALIIDLLFALSVYLWKIEYKKIAKVFLLLTVFSIGVLLFRQQTVGEIAYEQQKVLWRQITTDGQIQSPLVTRFFHNKAYETVRFGLQRISTYVEPEGFFITGSYLPGVKIIGAGFSLTALFPFFLYGLLLVIKERKNHFLLWWFLFGVLLGVVSVHVQHIILASSLLPVILLLSSYGVHSFIKNSPFKTIGVFSLLVINFIFVFAQYLPFL